GVEGAAREERQAAALDRDGDHAGLDLLARRGLPPAVSREARIGELPHLTAGPASPGRRVATATDEGGAAMTTPSCLNQADLGRVQAIFRSDSCRGIPLECAACLNPIGPTPLGR